MKIDYKLNNEVLDNVVYLGRNYINQLTETYGKLSIDSRLIFFNFGRRFGHTTYITNNAKMKDIIVVAYEINKEEYYDNGLSKKYSRIFTVDEIKKGYLRGLKVANDFTVWIDGYSYIGANTFLKDLNGFNSNITIVGLG